MNRVVLILYIIVFSLYIFFTRQPDYIDGEFATATIHFINNTPEASFSTDKSNYTINVKYLFRKFTEGQKVTLIYDNQNPQNAALYCVWGYWVRWQELLFSVILLLALFQIAVQVTSNPSAEALINELEGNKRVKKTKYDFD